MDRATDRQKVPSLPVHTSGESAQHFVQTEMIIIYIIDILYNNQRRLKPCIEQMLMHIFWSRCMSPRNVQKEQCESDCLHITCTKCDARMVAASTRRRRRSMSIKQHSYRLYMPFPTGNYYHIKDYITNRVSIARINIKTGYMGVNPASVSSTP